MNLLREDKGYYNDWEGFYGLMRMYPDFFHYLERRLTPRLLKKDTNWRRALPVGLKLGLTLRYLATGIEFTEMHNAWRVGLSTVGKVVMEVCEAIIAEFQAEVLVAPRNAEEWRAVARRFEERWNLPHCLGALDGKHCKISQPPHSGSLFFNYKKFFSIILLGLVNANYEFIWVDIGANGACSDAQIYNESALKTAIESKTIGWPPAEPLRNYDGRPIPYFAVGDDAFALKPWLLKPYPRQTGRQRDVLPDRQKIFNYRLSRGRRIVENAFGLLSQRWRVIKNGIQLSPDKARRLVLCCVVLHNLMRQHFPDLQDINLDGPEDAQGNFQPGLWRQDAGDFWNVEADNRGRANARGKDLRDYLADYFISEQGAIPFQERRIRQFIH